MARLNVDLLYWMAQVKSCYVYMYDDIQWTEIEELEFTIAEAQPKIPLACIL